MHINHSPPSRNYKAYNSLEWYHDWGLDFWGRGYFNSNPTHFAHLTVKGDPSAEMSGPCPYKTHQSRRISPGGKVVAETRLRGFEETPTAGSPKSYMQPSSDQASPGSYHMQAQQTLQATAAKVHSWRACCTCPQGTQPSLPATRSLGFRV